VSKWQRECLWYLESYAVVAGVALLVLLVLYLSVPYLRRRWLPLPRLRPTTWTGQDVFLTFCAQLGFPLLILAVLLQLGFFQTLIGLEPARNPDDRDLALSIYLLRCQSISSPLILSVTLAVILGMLYARSHTRPHQYGLTWARGWGNVALGLAAFLVGMPVIFGVHALASLLTAPRSHALEELAGQNLLEWEWVLLAFQPLVMAPLLEEIVFRGILQGWLGRASLIGHVVVLGVALQSAAVSVSYYDFATREDIIDPSPLIFAGILAAIYGFSMFRMTRRFALDDTEIQRWQLRWPGPRSEEGRVPDEILTADQERLQHWSDANASLAIFGSAMLFAVQHSNAWPSPVALVVMGFLLGWVRRRTQSLVAPITFHALFNLVSTLVLYLSVFAG
jgi:membrane protease YdiL (CAAX protease family)